MATEWSVGSECEGCNIAVAPEKLATHWRGQNVNVEIAQFWTRGTRQHNELYNPVYNLQPLDELLSFSSSSYRY